MKTWARAAEFVVMFVAAPAGLAVFMRRGLLFPALWLLFAVCIAVLLVDRTFEWRRLWNVRGVERHLPLLIGLGMVGAGVLVLILWFYDPGRLFELPRRNPRLWAMIMVLYPILSVYPQEVTFRAYFFHRYGPLFGNGARMVFASALAFGWAHLIMRNGWAIGFSTIGGLLFGITYLRTRSVLAACLEHAWYGCVLFTVGWGWYFYSGAVR